MLWSFLRRILRCGASPGRPKTAAAAAPAKRRARVYRVLGVPPDLDQASLLALLESHKDLSGCGLGIHTLAANADGSQTATIFFSDNRIPPRLAALGRRGALAVEIVVDASPESRRARDQRERDGPQTVTLHIDALLLGLTTLFTPPKEKHHFDVLAVHGLGGSHPYGSFVSHEDGHMWLKDDLPRVIPTARVMIYGYDTKLSNNPDCAKLVDLGGGLHLAMVGLWQHARPASTKPLVLIGLSLGGLLVKEALIQLSESSLWSSELCTVTGVLLFGAPNDGMLMESFQPIVQHNSNRLLLDSLNTLNPDELNKQKPAFARLLRRASFELFCFWERLPSPTARKTPGGGDDNYSMDGESVHIVTRTSATSCLPPGAPSERTVGMQTNHSNLVKFRRHDPEFEKVKPILIHICDPERGVVAADRLPSLTAAERECQAALSFARRETRGNEIAYAVKGTCEWLFVHEEYKRWLSCPSGLLWVKGIAGSGKSTLLRHALGRIKALPSAGEAPLVLDFFFDRQGDELQRSSLGLFRSLLEQVLTRAPRALAAFVDAFQQRSAAEKTPPDDAAKWSEGYLKAALRSSLTAVLQERPVWLLVDALDESGDEAAAVGVVDEFKALLDRISADGFSLRIIFTARQHLVLDGEYRFEITMQDNNEVDIENFIVTRLSTNPILKESNIGKLIMKRAGGLFMWAALAVERAHALQRAGRGLVSIERMIHETPAELAAVYHQMLNGLDAQDRSLTRKLFQWMCFAKRPLTVDEVKWALIVDAECSYKSLAECEDDDEFDSDMMTRVVYISRGLVRTQSMSSSDSSSSAQHVVRFIHQSVADFLLKEDGLASMHDDPTPASVDVARIAHYQLSRTCIRYLRMKEIAQLPAEALSSLSHQKELNSALPLFQYATMEWPTHARQSDQESLASSLGWPSDPFVDRWWYIYSLIRQRSPYEGNRPSQIRSRLPVGPLRDLRIGKVNIAHVAARHGLAGLLGATLTPSDRAAVDGRSMFVRTPLVYAVIKGYGATVEALLDAGADPGARNRGGREALSFAAEYGHASIVGALLARGAALDARDATGVTALHWAALGADQATLWKLLRAGADVEAEHSNGSTPLAAAIEAGREPNVATLLGSGSAVNHSYGLWKIKFDWDPYVPSFDAYAITAHFDQIDVKHCDIYSRMWTPLSRAVHKGSVAIVKLLLGKGALPDHAAECGPSPLSLARELGNEEMISLLEAPASEAG